MPHRGLPTDSDALHAEKVRDTGENILRDGRSVSFVLTRSATWTSRIFRDSADTFPIVERLSLGAKRARVLSISGPWLPRLSGRGIWRFCRTQPSMFALAGSTLARDALDMRHLSRASSRLFSFATT